MPKIPQTGGGGISRQEVEQIVHETDNKILNQLNNLENQLNNLENRVSNLERMIMTNENNPSSEAIIEIMSLKYPLNPALNRFSITLETPSRLKVVTPWGATLENYHGVGNYQTKYIDFKVYGAGLMMGDKYVYKIIN